MSDFGLANWRRLTRQTIDAFPAAMHAASDVIEVQAEQGAHDVIIGMSGATFASIVAYVASRDDDGAAATDAATTQALANSLRTALINLGLGV